MQPWGPGRGGALRPRGREPAARPSQAGADEPVSPHPSPQSQNLSMWSCRGSSPMPAPVTWKAGPLQPTCLLALRPSLPPLPPETSTSSDVSTPLPQPRAHLVGLAVGVEEGQAVEALVVLREAAEAQAERGDALLCEELALLLRASRQPLGEGSWLPQWVPSLPPIPRGRHRSWGLGRGASGGRGVGSRLLAALFCGPEAFRALRGLLGFS